jgi:hypothetical protein
MLSLTITNAYTRSQKGITNLFDPYGDALVLVLHFSASADLMAVQKPCFQAAFQIIEPRTNQVVVHESYFDEFHWGPNFWLAMGKNWGGGNYDTPHAWGLNWTPNSSEAIFGFRGLVKAYSWQGANGLESLDAFSVSDIHWFRVKEIYSP